MNLERVIGVGFWCLIVIHKHFKRAAHDQAGKAIHLEHGP
jgi:hypothetical protein